MRELQDLWNSVLELMCGKHSFSSTTMTLWFGEAELTELTENGAVISHPSAFKKEIIEKRYKPLLCDAFEEIVGFPVTVTVVLSSERAAGPGKVPFTAGEKENFSADREYSETRGSDDVKPFRETPFQKNQDEGRFFSQQDSAKINRRDLSDDLKDNASVQKRLKDNALYTKTSSMSDTASGAEKDEKQADTSLRPSFSGEYTFENFVVGSSNKFAHAACTAVAANPAREYNPLFIYGSSGLGKTHLLNAVMNEVKKNNPNINMIYVKGDEFTNQMIESIAKHSQELFRAKYRKADVLLIDDIQFIAGKDSTQEEFFHTFNALYEDRKQIILTSDRPPRDIKTLEDRLKTRFEWGLIVDIQPPDFELRIAIMKNKAKKMGITLPDDVMNMIAENLKSNIRQIEGAIKRICAKSFLNGEPITLELARDCISALIVSNDPPEMTAKKIVETVSKKYGVPTDEIYGRKRTKQISNARNISIYIIRKITSLSLVSIAQLFDRDHTTVMSAIKSTESEISMNHLLEIEINEMIKELTE